MNPFKVIISLPIIVAKIVWRFLLIALLSFPISGFFIVPTIYKKEYDSLIGFCVVILILAVIISIRVWKKSYDNSGYEKWKW